MDLMQRLLAESSALHRHLCPRQVLGVRMGMLAGEMLGLKLPQPDKRVLTFVETDGCFADGVAVATNCWVGRRTLHVLDHGKTAATFVDSLTGRAIRIHPHPLARSNARAYAPEVDGRWESYLVGYQRMPSHLLLIDQPVTLLRPVEEYLSRPSARAICQACSEEIINEREVLRQGSVLCRPCAGESYCRVASSRAAQTSSSVLSVDHLQVPAVTPTR